MRCIVTSALLIGLLTPSSVVADGSPDEREEFEEAVDEALEYLERTQNRDGSWTSGSATRDPAVTALCVMAFLSAGHVPGEGPYGDNVERGVEFVLDSQKRNGLFAHSTQGAYEMYCHGICTLMVAEVVGMMPADQADSLREKLALGVEIILQGQRTSGSHKGGWRYRIEYPDADLSVTGWQLMALRAAKNVGCDVPGERIEWAVQYVQNCRDRRTGGYRYMIDSQVTVPCTGTAVLCLELAGAEYHRSDEALEAGDYLKRNPLNPKEAHFFYGVYYTSQAMFQLGDDYWTTYRSKLHTLLLRSNPPAGNGSWSAGSRFAWDDQNVGPSYCTAMAVLALTVEYRFLPIYQRGTDSIDP